MGARAGSLATGTVHLTRIYTALGDDGTTALGDMSRVPKTDPRIEAYSTVEEANAVLGLALAIGDLAGICASGARPAVRRCRCYGFSFPALCPRRALPQVAAPLAPPRETFSVIRP